MLGKVQPDTVTTGRALVLSMDEEARIVEHLQTVAKFNTAIQARKLLTWHLISSYSFGSRHQHIHLL